MHTSLHSMPSCLNMLMQKTSLVKVKYNKGKKDEIDNLKVVLPAIDALILLVKFHLTHYFGQFSPLWIKTILLSTSFHAEI